MLIYIRNKNNRKSGGNHSQEILSKLIENNGGMVFCLEGNSWSRFLKKLFKCSLIYKESKKIYSINLLETKPYKFMGIYIGGYFLKRFINKFIFSITIKNLISETKEHKYKAILEVFEIDYYEILKKRFEDIKIASLLRSSPHCLIWSNSFLLKDNIIKCINSSEFIISASRDVSDMWIDISKNRLIKFFRINVPIEEKKLIKFNFDKDKIYTFICITGAVGPRKGIYMMINSIGKLMKKINKKGKVILLGVCDDNTKKLIHKQISLFKGFLQVEMTGYRLSSVNLNCNKKKSYFIFCSYSENQSRAHLEALKYDLPILINIKSISAELFNEQISSNQIKLFCSSEDLQAAIISLIESNKQNSKNIKKEANKNKKCITVHQVKKQLLIFEDL